MCGGAVYQVDDIEKKVLWQEENGRTALTFWAGVDII